MTAPMTTLRHTIVLSPDPMSIKRARDEVVSVLREWGLAVYADDFRLCVSELVTNALRHGQGRLEVCLLHDEGRLRCEVHDGSARPPLRRQVNSSAGGGRGLHLVESVVGELGGVWGVGYPVSCPGKAVFFEVPVPPGPARGPLVSSASPLAARYMAEDSGS